uniref:Uncharacterized protein n=1 Tax=Aegilops tauschii subsp. strangulata TaxID=200361 RepID=A0A453GJ40_AEGTS
MYLYSSVGLAGDHGDAGVAAEPGDGAVGSKNVGGDIVWRATHDRHASVHTHLVHVVGAVGLAEHAVHVVGEVVELEPDVEVREAVARPRDAIVVDARVLLGDRHHVGHDVEHAPQVHPHSVGGRGPRDGQPWHRGRLPPCADLDRDLDGRVVEGHLEVVDVAVPAGGILGSHEETVVGEADAEGLDPGEVAAHGGVALADEVGVDVEVGVGDDAEVLVLLAVEVEVVAVAAGEARVTAGHARVEVAHAVCLAAGAEDDALVGAALVALAHAARLPAVGVLARQLLAPLPELARADHVVVGRQLPRRLGLDAGGRRQGAHGHQSGHRSNELPRHGSFFLVDRAHSSDGSSC